MGFADYFLIVWDFISFAKRNGIGVGPGRGSAAGSLAAYCLEITDVDPMRYGLLFERFLNPGRKSMPDMDLDFSVHGRDRVINYVAEKYGRDRVAQIITFGTMMARAAVRDAGRVLEIPYGTVDKIAKLIPEGPKVYLDDSTGVFQFESSGMRDALRQVKPTEFEDLIALSALYRPGPMAYIPVYARRKNGQEQVSYIDTRLEEITSSTYGICVYQEQYLEIAKQIAGFTPAEADDLRKAIGKKIHELMASLKEKFLEGCAGTGTTPAVANQLWKDMEQSQDYSFNKAHAACYALTAYRTAWLKAHHPHEYMAALISSVMNTKDRVPFYVNACREMGIEVLPPEVNASECDFAVVEERIRFGLNAVKNVGDSAARAIVAAREEGGPYASLWDFTERVDPQVVNKRALESLVKCGALDSTGASRRGMLEALEHALSHGQRAQDERLRGQASLFAEADEKPQHPPIGTEEFEKNDLLRLEKETLGLYVSEHPLEAIRDQLRRKTDSSLAELERRRDGEVVTVAGIVSGLRQLTTKKGDPMVFMRLDDVLGSAEVVVFNSVYAAARELLVVDSVLVVKARIDHKEGETKLIALEVSSFEAVPERREVRLRLDARQARAGIIREIAALVKDFPGEAPVVVDLVTSDGPRVFQLWSEFRVQPVPDFFAEAKALLGEAAVA